MFYSDHPPQIHTSEPARTTHVTLASANVYLIRACFDTPYGVPGSVQWRSIRLEAEAAHRQIQLFGQLTQGNHRIGYLLRDRIPLSSHAREMLDVRGDVPPALALFTHCDSNRVNTTGRVTDQTPPPPPASPPPAGKTHGPTTGGETHPGAPGAPPPPPPPPPDSVPPAARRVW